MFVHCTASVNRTLRDETSESPSVGGVCHALRANDFSGVFWPVRQGASACIEMCMAESAMDAYNAHSFAGG